MSLRLAAADGRLRPGIHRAPSEMSDQEILEAFEFVDSAGPGENQAVLSMRTGKILCAQKSAA